MGWKTIKTSEKHQIEQYIPEEEQKEDGASLYSMWSKLVSDADYLNTDTLIFPSANYVAVPASAFTSANTFATTTPTSTAAIPYNGENTTYANETSDNPIYREYYF